MNTGKSRSFLEMLWEKDPGFTGSPVFMEVLYQSARSEAAKAGIIVFATLFIILFLHFRSVKAAIIAFTPMTFALLVTAGLMEIAGLEWNILNVLALPVIIGIGIDDGVHILHRYRNSSLSIEKVFSSVGRAIFTTSLTTMAGFGALMLSSYRGIAYMGAVLFIGVGAAFLMTVLIIPVLIKGKYHINKTPQ